MKSQVGFKGDLAAFFKFLQDDPRFYYTDAEAEAALGAHFDVKEFHSQILRDGALPLGVLEANIDRWIQSRRAS